MGLIITVGTFVLGLLASEAKPILRWLTPKVLTSAVKKLPESLRDRYAEEWEADIAALPGALVPFFFAADCRLRAAGQIRSDFLALKFGIRSRSALERAVRAFFGRAYAATVIIAVAPGYAVIAALLAGGTSILVRERLCGQDRQTVTRARFRTCAMESGGPRLTITGTILRSTGLDLLPVMFSVLRGDMAIVGPYPVREDEIEEIYGAAAHIYATMKPGLIPPWIDSPVWHATTEERAASLIRHAKLGTLWTDLRLMAHVMSLVATMRSPKD